jgi:UDP-glucose 4-epimerase
MKVLLTGVTGAVGAFVAEALAQGHELVLFARRPVESAHAQVQGDLLDLDQCKRALEGCQAVVHLAAYSSPAPEAFRTNVEGTFHLLEAACGAGVERFIFASTNCVYGHCFRTSRRPFPLNYLPIDEAHPCRPEDNYGVSKRLCEEMLAGYAGTWGLRTAAFRLNWVWGPQEHAQRLAQQPFRVEAQAPYFWAYVDGRDVGCAVRQALEAADLPASGSYNISAADHQAEEDSASLAERFYKDVPVRGELAGRASFFDWQKAHRTFGYRPMHSWRDA